MDKERVSWFRIAKAGAGQAPVEPTAESMPVVPGSIAETSIRLGDELCKIRTSIIEYSRHHHIDLTTPFELNSSDMSLQVRTYFDTVSQLAEINIGLIDKVFSALTQQMYVPDKDDVYQEGFFGLFFAACNYNPWLRDPKNRSVQQAIRFSSYACECIKDKMLSALQMASSNRYKEKKPDEIYSSLPEVYQLFKASENVAPKSFAYAYLKANNHRVPKIDEVEKFMQALKSQRELRDHYLDWLIPRQISEAWRMAAGYSDETRVCQRNEQGDLEEKWLTYLSIIEDNVPNSSQLRPTEAEVIENQDNEAIHNLLSILNPISRKVLELRAYEHMTIEETARALKIPLNSVRAIEAKALRILRQPSRIWMLK